MVYLFLSKSQHGDHGDHRVYTDRFDFSDRLKRGVHEINRLDDYAGIWFGNTIVRTPPGHYRNQQTVAGLLDFVFSANRRLPSVGQNNSCTSLQ